MSPYFDSASPRPARPRRGLAVMLAASMEGAEDCADRQAVIDGFFAIENRESALGTYSIDENGDTTLSDYGGYRPTGGKLVFDRAIKAEAV